MYRKRGESALKRESLLSTLSLSMNDAELPATTIIRPRRSLIMDLVHCLFFFFFLFVCSFVSTLFFLFCLLLFRCSCRRIFEMMNDSSWRLTDRNGFIFLFFFSFLFFLPLSLIMKKKNKEISIVECGMKRKRGAHFFARVFESGTTM